MSFIRILFFFFMGVLSAQNGFQLENGKKSTIHFQLINNLIFIPININGVDLTFLLDSGVHQTLLFSLTDEKIDFKQAEKMNFTGLGEDYEIEGFKSINNRIKIGDDFLDNQHTIYILSNGNIDLSKHVGIPVNGIIGYNFFKNHPVEIDFLSKKITVYNNSEQIERKIKRFSAFDISIELNKPYLYADVELNQKLYFAKFLIDLGNSDGLWLFPNLADGYLENHPHISDYLGSGFNGDIHGNRMRIDAFYIGDYTLEKPLVAAPTNESIRHLTIVKDREGSIGNEIMRRFRMIIDYGKNKIYFRKNRHYKDPFLFNKSGLTIQQDGTRYEPSYVQVETALKSSGGFGLENPLSPTAQTTTKLQYKFVLTPVFSVLDCRKNSPCDEAGIKKGDKILSVKNTEAGKLTLQRIGDILREGKEGKVIKFQLQRGDSIYTTHITLTDPIPFELRK